MNWRPSTPTPRCASSASPPGRSSTRSRPVVSEATDQLPDLSGYRETPAPRVLLVEGRQACYGDQRHFGGEIDA